MKKTVLAVVFLLAVSIPTLIAAGVDLGMKLGVQSPSFALQAELDVSSDLTVGLFAESSLDLIFNPASVQTRPLTVGLQAKHRFPIIHPAFESYLGVAGRFDLLGLAATIGMDAIAGARLRVARNLTLFAEAALFIVPFPDLAAWYDLTRLYRTLYLGFSLRL